MRALYRCMSSLGVMVIAGSLHAAPMASHFPATDLGQFLAQTFDLASIRSSFGPRRTPALRTFADFGMTPSRVTERLLEFDVPGHWYYALEITGRRDVNNDGIEDLEVCFTDGAQNGGTYRDRKALVITRYAPDAYALALHFDPDERVCAAAAR